MNEQFGTIPWSDQTLVDHDLSLPVYLLLLQSCLQQNGEMAKFSFADFVGIFSSIYWSENKKYNDIENSDRKLWNSKYLWFYTKFGVVLQKQLVSHCESLGIRRFVHGP